MYNKPFGWRGRTAQMYVCPLDGDVFRQKKFEQVMAKFEEVMDERQCCRKERSG
jgi:hypothetical protein